MLRDMQLALRQMRRSPGFTLTAILILSFGIGAAVAVFTVVDCVLFNPLPYPSPNQIVLLSSSYKEVSSSYVMRAAQFRFLQQDSQTFDAIAASENSLSGVNLTDGGEPEHVSADFVSSELFRVLGVTPLHGRFFNSSEENPGSGCVTVVSNKLWTERFNSEHSLLGRPITVNGKSCIVIGILPKDFQYYLDAEMFLPLQIAPEPQLGHYYLVLARLKSHVSMNQARADSSRVFSRFKAQHNDLTDPGEVGIQVDRYDAILVSNLHVAIWTLFGAVFLFLLIACANVSNLQLSRTLHRRREIALRAALGASTLRIARQSIAENALLVIAAGGIGLALASTGIPLLLHMGSDGLPKIAQVSINQQVLAFSVLICALVLFLGGLPSVILSSRLRGKAHLLASGKTITDDPRGKIFRSAFMGTQVALSVVLFTGALLLIRSFDNLERVNLGFSPLHVVTFKTFLPSQYSTTSRTWQFEQQVVARIAALPGVEGVVSATSLPLQAGPDMPGVILSKPTQITINPAYRPVNPDYFRVLGVPVLRGRAFEFSDDSGAPRVAIINYQMARKYFGDSDPLGQDLKLGVGLGKPFDDSPRMIIGVVGDVREEGPNVGPGDTVYIPRAQIPDSLTGLMNPVLPVTWAVQSQTAPAALLEPIRRAVLNVDPQQPISDFGTMDSALSSTYGKQRFTLSLMSLFAVLAILLAAVGTYAVASYQVRSRESELGIRLSLGAIPNSIVRLIAIQTLRPVLLGVAAGILYSLALASLVRSLLFGVGPADTTSLVASAITLSLVSSLAGYFPARRAARLDPVRVLRAE